VSDIAKENPAAKPAKARRTRRKRAVQEDIFREEVGPTELYDPIIRTEIKRAAVWIGMTAFVVGLVWLAQPLLLIMGGLVLAAMFDGGARLLGRVLPIPRGIRLTIVVLAVFGFMYWTFVFTGSELAAQAASLQAIVETQIESIGNRIAAAGFNISAEDVKSFGTQILNSVGRVTEAVSSVVGTVTNMAMMLVLAIFIAAEPRMYERGVAWMLPLAEREHFYVTAGCSVWRWKVLAHGYCSALAAYPWRRFWVCSRVCWRFCPISALSYRARSSSLSDFRQVLMSVFMPSSYISSFRWSTAI
jgi:hypothetical protein